MNRKLMPTSKKLGKTGRSEDRLRLAAINRVSRIEGQLRGIRRMIEEKDRCLDVITQIMAVRSAISMLGVELIKDDLLCHRGKSQAITEDNLKKLFLLS
jgi:DNA-binding FrmR family transcriptional regulator